ncbi:MAG: hypothetical protein AAFV53_14365 [Myxococcota bacterium]
MNTTPSLSGTSLFWADVAWHTVNDRLDEDGRPLGEHASPDAYAVSPRDERPCPYRDERQGQVMNAAALRQVRVNWPTIRTTLCDWATPNATVRQAWMVTLAATMAPMMTPAGCPVPVAWSAMYKTCIGFHQLLTFLILAEAAAAETPLSALATPEEFQRWLSREGWLVGQTQVCAGPAAMIAAGFQALCGDGTGAGAGSPLPRPAEEAVRQVAGWQALTLAAVLRAQAVGGHREDAVCSRLLKTSKAPWLSVVRLRPGWPAVAARRLVVDEKNRAGLDRFLSSPHQTLLEIDVALSRETEKILG